MLLKSKVNIIDLNGIEIRSGELFIVKCIYSKQGGKSVMCLSYYDSSKPDVTVYIEFLPFFEIKN
jgi:hypothetical protein